MACQTAVPGASSRTMLDFEYLPPRSFRDAKVPRREDESLLTGCRDETDYDRYVEWLQEHLTRAALPLTPQQEAWMAQKAMEPEPMVIECADSLGSCLPEMSLLEDFFEDAAPWTAFEEHMRRAWQTHDPEDQEEYPFEDWLGITKPTYDRLLAEWQEQQEFASQISHLDIGFRPLLSWALRQIPAKEQRLKLLHQFYNIVDDNASK